MSGEKGEVLLSFTGAKDLFTAVRDLLDDQDNQRTQPHLVRDQADSEWVFLFPSGAFHP